MGVTKERDYYFDNVKFILILLVVVGHAIEPLVNTNLNLKAVYIFIYTFHMPLFILVSGYFAKNITADHYFLKTVRRILVPYLIFQVFYFLFFRFVFTGVYNKFTIFTPYWIMWFLLAMFIWKLVLPYFVKLKYPLLISVIIAIGAGYIPQIGSFMALSRTITFFPFFLLGYYLKKEHIDKLFTKKNRIISIIILLSGLAGIFYFAPDIYYGWFYGSSCYANLHATDWYAGVYRLGVYAVAILLSASVLTLVPRKKNVFSEMAMRTMYLYLFHGFIIKLFVKYNLYGICHISVIILISILISLMLSSKYVEKVAKPIVQP